VTSAAAAAGYNIIYYCFLLAAVYIQLIRSDATAAPQFGSNITTYYIILYVRFKWFTVPKKKLISRCRRYLASLCVCVWCIIAASIQQRGVLLSSSGDDSSAPKHTAVCVNPIAHSRNWKKTTRRSVFDETLDRISAKRTMNGRVTNLICARLIAGLTNRRNFCLVLGGDVCVRYSAVIILWCRPQVELLFPFSGASVHTYVYFFLYICIIVLTLYIGRRTVSGPPPPPRPTTTTITLDIL